MTHETLSLFLSLPLPTPLSSSQYQYPSLYLFGSGACIYIRCFRPPPPPIIVPWLTTLRTHGGKEGGEKGKKEELVGWGVSTRINLCVCACVCVCAVRMCVCSASTPSTVEQLELGVTCTYLPAMQEGIAGISLLACFACLLAI